MELNTVVSIIIPVFNAEQTLSICLNSLRQQTYPYLQLLFVNDASTDGSVALLQQFAEAYASHATVEVKMLTHQVNQGVAAARNTGLQEATGEFIYYVDADDAIEPDTLSLSVQLAKEKQLDIVGFNWYLQFAKNERKMQQPQFKEPLEAIELMLSGRMRWNLWLFLVRRSLYTTGQINFIAGANMGEDLMVMVKLFVQAQKVAYLDKACYHYGQSNVNSMTKQYSEKHIQEVSLNVAEVESYLRASAYRSQLGNLLHYLKLNIKLPLLVSSKKSNYELWLRWFAESNAYVLENGHLSWRTRGLQWMAAKRQFWALKLYYYLVFRLVYGFLYK